MELSLNLKTSLGALITCDKHVPSFLVTVGIVKIFPRVRVRLFKLFVRVSIRSRQGHVWALSFRVQLKSPVFFSFSCSTSRHMFMPTAVAAFGKGGISHLPFRKTGRHIAAFTLEWMCRLFYLKMASDRLSFSICFLVQWKLNCQSEGFLSPKGSAASSTCSITRKTEEKGRLVPTGSEHTAKTWGHRCSTTARHWLTADRKKREKSSNLLAKKQIQKTQFFIFCKVSIFTDFYLKITIYNYLNQK